MNLKLSDELCRALITNNGVCKRISCEHCPGSEKYNNGSFCHSNGWSGNINDEDDYKNNKLQSAINWLKLHEYTDNIYVEEL